MRETAMIRFLYKEWDKELIKKLLDFRQLLDLFNFLLLKSNGDAEAALDLMRYLQGRGLIDPSVNLDDFTRKLEEQEFVRRDETTGQIALTGKGIRDLRRSSLERIFQDLNAGGHPGDHRTPHGGGSGPEQLPESRGYVFGDDLRSIDFTESIWNSVRREGVTHASLEESDLVVRDSEFSSSCATVLLLDVSHSMVLYGEDRFTPAKQVALALTELILTRYTKDTLDVVLFGDKAMPIATRDLPFAKVGPYHTNTKAGLVYARRILERRKNPNKQIFMVTDGKPTVIDVPGEGRYRNVFGLDERIMSRTLDEAVICRRKGIPITTFMVARDPHLEQFVMKMTEENRGRAYFTSPGGLGGYVLYDFIRNRRTRV
jgi:Ca-activated chloride channel family protein